MSAQPPRAPGEGKRLSGAFLSLLAVSFSELRRDVDQLQQSGWDEPLRRRALELASTLAEACLREGLPELAAQARSIANLAHLPKAKALAIREALREKFDSLLRGVEIQLAKHSKRYIS